MDSFSKFSDRYGYTSPESVLRRESLSDEDINVICNCYDSLEELLNKYDRNNDYAFPYSYPKVEETIWCVFLKKRKKDFREYYNNHKAIATEFIQSPTTIWYEVFNILDFTLCYLKETNSTNVAFQRIVSSFISLLNTVFRRQNLAYRIVDYQVAEITDDREIATIEEALTVSDNVRTHLNNALKHLSSRPTPDYRNSIKESISAVESLCRSITGESKFGDALKCLEKNGIEIPHMLKKAFESLYAYTNDKTTGIRHALIDASETPSYEEAKYMLIICSAFINYVESKKAL